MWAAPVIQETVWVHVLQDMGTLIDSARFALYYASGFANTKIFHMDGSVKSVIPHKSGVYSSLFSPDSLMFALKWQDGNRLYIRSLLHSLCLLLIWHFPLVVTLRQLKICPKFAFLCPYTESMFAQYCQYWNNFHFVGSSFNFSSLSSSISPTDCVCLLSRNIRHA